MTDAQLWLAIVLGVVAVVTLISVGAYLLYDPGNEFYEGAVMSQDTTRRTMPKALSDYPCDAGCGEPIKRGSYYVNITITHRSASPAPNHELGCDAE